jgi:hypothetical protein
MNNYLLNVTASRFLSPFAVSFYGNGESEWKPTPVVHLKQQVLS